jgi:hypothetical protein
MRNLDAVKYVLAVVGAFYLVIAIYKLVKP